MKCARHLLLLVLFSVAAVNLMGCSSYFKRKECEAKNWYQYGFDLAMKGQRINNDDFVMECRKAEAEIQESQLDTGFKAGMSNYCKSEVVFQTGRSGEFLNLDLCDPGQSRSLRARHAEGVKGFCDARNAYQVGASGKVYNKICPPELEKAFVPEYQRGRKRYLQAMISETQGKTNDLERRTRESERETRNLQMQLAMIPPPQQVINRTVTPQGLTETTSTNDPYQDKRRRITDNIRLSENQSRELQTQRTSLQDELYEYQRELQTLE